MKWVLASSNAGKIKEFSDLLAPLNIEIVPQAQLNITDAVEDGLSFVENAIIKARHACQQSGLAAIADDSGLEVDALNGAPGIYSARYAGDTANDSDNLTLLLNNMQGQKNRRARFQCVIAFMRHAKDPTPIICQASWEGEILQQPVGIDGFGYDPIFAVKGLGQSSAQLNKKQKNAISHRGQAIALFKQRLAQIMQQ